MAAKYRVGVIASGRIAREHGRGWAECEHTEIAAIADAHPEALASYAADFDVKATYTDYREMLDKENLDIISVCSWDPQHAEMSIAACSRRPKAVLCEKPMAISLGEADAMIIAAQRNEVKLAIGHQRRFYSCWREARRMIADGAIGKPQRLWSAIKAGMMNTGTHCIDFQLYALGDPKVNWVMGSVERHTDHFVFGHRVEDRCAGIIGYEGGIEGVIENEMNDTYQVGAHIYGEDGMLAVNDNSLRYMNASSGGWKEFEPDEKATGGYGNAFVDQAYGICRWIEGDFEDYYGKAEHGKAATEIMMAVYESARMHERVSLPLQTRANPLDVAVEEGRIPVTRPGFWDERSFLVRGESMSWVKDK
ncbi:MAG: Gfo/Idh/MocA family oxidoreductase [Gemmatimonadetes bacterium]|jgi:predicted dehydrogenase|nr:Gfo/Idh/MocA family oxidoreductase [Gemmatimonadota bacterium]MBT5453164.1 Gfo/Idh/MocA family oxidoreductase [Gemmatimonadota bacterium]MBT5800212.1 Gfo/Idh/MocA family oxidoreductase [Gemmatimonadota bacterium]MBT6620503.1 Gfo/Idh/MocA family oxidoreductase [Gemmatimonadota bacterium]MBT6904391.1 Gfo/Idh/MocA family oxidoreductase [Gemmatimonadota bacterium]